MTRRPVALFSFALVAALAAGAEAEVAELPPLPERNPSRKAAVLKPLLPRDQPTVAWTEPEITSASATCKELLTGDPLDYELLPPIKEGVCGTPSPVLLRAVGHDPKVTIDPPATLSCPMADALGQWLRDTVQPEAKALFGSPVAKISNASSYVCRNRYGGGSAPLSEHALANAFDVSEFVLANGVRISVLEHWPRVPPAPVPVPNPARVGGGASSRTVVKQEGGTRGPDVIPAAEADREARPSLTPVGEEPALAPSSARVGTSASSNPFVKQEGGDRGSNVVTPAKADGEASPSVPSVPSVAEEPVSVSNPARSGARASSNPFVKREVGKRGQDLVTPAKADGDEPPSIPPVAEEAAPDPKGRFVTFLHADACRRFGTVLGPNANEAHKDHFHLDMKKRRRTGFCE